VYLWGHIPPFSLQVRLWYFLKKDQRIPEENNASIINKFFF